MHPIDLEARLLALWRRHNGILLYLLDEIPEEGLAAVPAQSSGRDVARQLDHLHQVRTAWLHYHETGERVRTPSAGEGERPTKERLRRALAESGARVEEWLAQALTGAVRPRLFGGDPVRWLGYLIAHESHHRGQIMLALKQNGMRMPEKVAVQGLWGKWIFGE